MTTVEPKFGEYAIKIRSTSKEYFMLAINELPEQDKASIEWDLAQLKTHLEKISRKAQPRKRNHVKLHCKPSSFPNT